MAPRNTAQLLDDAFGPLIDPRRGRLNPSELTMSPASVFSLEGEGASRLKGMMKLVEDAFYLSHCLFSAFSLLWVLDGDGKVFMALEEGLAGTEMTDQYPLPRAIMRSQAQKLGHPALIGCRSGRIGGELTYDLRYAGGPWVLSNKSGRFGYPKERTAAHLDNVVALFKDADIHVVPSYMPPEF